MPVTIVSAGKFRRAVKTSESTDSKKIADKTSIDVSKSDHDTDDDFSSQVKALVAPGKNKKLSVKKGCELITRLKQLIADKEKLASSTSPLKSKRKRVDSPILPPSPPYFTPQLETDYSEVDYREFSDEEKELQALRETASLKAKRLATQVDSDTTISDENTVVKSNAPSDSKDDQKVAKRNASDEEEIITNYIDESIAPSEPKDNGIVLRDYEVERKRFLPKRNEIQSQKGYTDRNCKTPLYSTGLITRDRYEEIRSKVDVDSTSSDLSERIDDYLISSFHYLLSHPSSQLSGVDERAVIETFLREVKNGCSENRKVCADRRSAIYNRLRKLESYPEEISSRVKDLEESLELVQKRLTAQTELYDDLKESYDLLYHRHEVKTVKTLKELMGHVKRLNKRFDLPLPRSSILNPVQQDFVDKSQSYLDDPSPIALEESAKPPTDPPLEKSDTS